MSVKDALDNYSRRYLGIKKKRTNKKNKQPEREVQKEVLAWCSATGFDVSVVESKAVYSRSAGRYLRGQATAGFSDLAGVTPDGTGCFIELKAPNKLSTFRHAQYDYLCSKIRKGAFGCCVDSVCLLADLYRVWVNLKKNNTTEHIDFLLQEIPKPRNRNDELSW